MTQVEFKAWFEGFCENVGTQPTPAQWERIKEQVRAMTITTPTITSPYRAIAGGAIAGPASGVVTYDQREEQHAIKHKTS